MEDIRVDLRVVEFPFLLQHEWKLKGNGSYHEPSVIHELFVDYLFTY